MRLALPFACLLLLGACTDAGLYSTTGEGPNPPDRAAFEGRACVPLATGDAFPVRVLFAVPGGAGIDREVVGQVTSALDSLSARFNFPYIKFSLVAYHTVATGLAGSFQDITQLQNAISRYNAYNESGPWSLRAPLKLSQSLIAGDMSTGCKGLVARTRYLVVLVLTDADRSCSNPAFNAGIDSQCDAFMPAFEDRCAMCELGAVTSQVKDLADRYRAGEVTVQPIYVRTTPDDLIVSEANAIARSGGTQLIQTDPGALKNVINSLNYASLQRELRLKRVIALNRSALARNSVLLTDSDGDGLADEDEEARGTDPAAYDTDLDGVGDGVEAKMGLDPAVLNTFTGCNPFLDTDGDRLNDCEEYVLGTDSCISDTDGDTLPDLVELLSGTNLLAPEDLEDSDHDGINNVDEVAAHTDPNSADLAFRDERGYGYSIKPAPPTTDGRACYDIKIRNVGLVTPRVRPNPPYDDIPEGQNEIYVYLQVGRDNDPRGTGIGSLYYAPVTFLPPATRDPAGVIQIQPDEFVVGN